MAVPLAQEIPEIRHLCPNLEQFRVDITLRGRRAAWPYDVLKELATFEKPMVLTLYLHNRSQSTRANMSMLFNAYFRISKFFLNERQRQNIPWQTPFVVNFRDVKPAWDDESIAAPDILDCCFKIEKGRFGTCCKWSYLYPTICIKENLDKMSLEDLRKRSQRRFRNLFRSQSKYKDEIARREEGYGSDITLYDLWTWEQQD
jgi:hypothetical protein